MPPRGGEWEELTKTVTLKGKKKHFCVIISTNISSGTGPSLGPRYLQRAARRGPSLSKKLQPLDTNPAPTPSLVGTHGFSNNLAETAVVESWSKAGRLQTSVRGSEKSQDGAQLTTASANLEAKRKCLKKCQPELLMLSRVARTST